MEKNQKSQTELNNTQKKEESNKLEEQKKSSTNKESSNINSIIFKKTIHYTEQKALIIIYFQITKVYIHYFSRKF